VLLALREGGGGGVGGHGGGGGDHLLLRLGGGLGLERAVALVGGARLLFRDLPRLDGGGNVGGERVALDGEPLVEVVEARGEDAGDEVDELLVVAALPAVLGDDEGHHLRGGEGRELVEAVLERVDHGADLDEEVHALGELGGEVGGLPLLLDTVGEEGLDLIGRHAREEGRAVDRVAVGVALDVGRNVERRGRGLGSRGGGGARVSAALGGARGGAGGGRHCRERGDAKARGAWERGALTSVDKDCIPIK